MYVVINTSMYSSILDQDHSNRKLRSIVLTMSETVGVDLETRLDPLVSTGLDTEYLSKAHGVKTCLSGVSI